MGDKSQIVSKSEGGEGESTWVLKAKGDST